MKSLLFLFSVLAINFVRTQSSDIKPFFYPNPTKQYIYFALVDDSISYEIVSLQGQVILKGIWYKNESQFLDLHFMTPGNYFIKINDEVFHLKKDE